MPPVLLLAHNVLPMQRVTLYLCSIRQMWPSAGILIVMEACLVMIYAAAGVLEFFPEEATTSLGRMIRS